jgi:predicted porin
MAYPFNHVMNTTKTSSLKTVILTGLFMAFGYSPAAAESAGDVQVYGRIVNGINYQSHQNTGRVDGNGRAVTGSVWSMNGNVWGTSMFGIRGYESLGGRTQILFDLQMGFDASDGAVTGGSNLWSRRSLVGVSGDAGILRLGRSLTLPTEAMWRMDPSGQQAMGTATLVNGRNWPTYSNQIDYTSPNFGGFTVQGVYGLGETPGSAKKSSTGGIALVYVQPLFEVRGMYDVANDQDGKYSTLFQYSRQFTLGSTLNIDKWKLFAGYQKLSAPDAVSGPDKANHYWLGANYWATPRLMLLGGAFHVTLNRPDDSANLFMAGGNYYLSKRTLLYASIGTLRNGDQTSFAIQTYNGGPGVSGAIGQNQNSFYTGISHSF